MISEGFATVMVEKAHAAGNEEPHPTEESEGQTQSVFYNPAQVVNRDLSVCAISLFSELRQHEAPRKGGVGDKGITILEALSATGLRSVRYWKEIPHVRNIIANDLDQGAVATIARNCALNHVPLVSPSVHSNFNSARGVVCNHDDCNVLMQRLALGQGQVRAGHRFVLVGPDDTTSSTEAPRGLQPQLQQELVDVVDLDPYGSASPFLDSAFGCCKEGALMLVTSTDSAILCGNYPDTCHAKYSSVGFKGDACHEVAVRVLLAAAERAANKHRKYIVPLLSLHIDFYVRCFFRVYTQPAETKLSACKLGHVTFCTKCPNTKVFPLALGRNNVKRQRDAPCVNRTRGSDEQHDAAPTTGPRLASFPPPPSRDAPFKVQPTTVPPDVGSECDVCHGSMQLAGPIYAATIQNRPFLQKLLDVVNKRAEANQITAVDRVRGLIRAALDELPDTPLFYALPQVASLVRCRLPQTPLVVGALASRGYQCSQVHCCRFGLKTNAPFRDLVAVMLRYKEYDESSTAAAEDDVPKDTTTTTATTPTEQKPTTTKQLALASAGRHLFVDPMPDVTFAYAKENDFRSSATGVTKFILNAPGWGPKRRHQPISGKEKDTEPSIA